MALMVDQQKNEIVESVAGIALAQQADPQAPALARFIRLFYAHVPPEDVLRRRRTTSMAPPRRSGTSRSSVSPAAPSCRC